MNWYRLELNTKVSECSRRVTKCKEDDRRKGTPLPRGWGGVSVLAAPKSLGYLHPLEMGGICAKDGLDPAVPNAGRADGRWGSPAAETRGAVFSCRLR